MEMLLAGPRGRRLLLEFALASERQRDPEYREESLTAGVFLASYHLDPGKGTSVQLFGDVGAETQEISPAEIASRMGAVPLVEVTPELLRDCVAESVSAARYWQEPDGTDILAGMPELAASLRRVAAHLAASPHTAWWSAPVEERLQWQVEWDGAPPRTVLEDPLSRLRHVQDEVLAEELTARRERPTDPAASWSGSWWSRPPWELPSSTRALPDGAPAGLWFVEDTLGWEHATTRRVGIPAGLRIFEIDTAEAWASLCRRFPIEVTAQKRHDWYRTTGRDGSWAIPDWAKVAEHYDAVHLCTLTYLSAASTAIPVDNETASVIAGWGPDETYWFTPRVRYVDEPIRWALHDDGEDNTWVREES
ncbi:hypothetical protein [Microbacterium sp. GXF6406]